MIELVKRYLSYIGRAPFCNKNKNRAPKVFDYCFVLCWRCAGLIMGGIIGSLFYNTNILSYKNNILFISILSMPFIVDVLMQSMFEKESTNAKRALTGLLFGIALANFRPI
ncbi:DUF2085 domain-containing protein [Candidatus Omnitrophota bacterium]